MFREFQQKQKPFFPSVSLRKNIVSFNATQVTIVAFITTKLLEKVFSKSKISKVKNEAIKIASFFIISTIKCYNDCMNNMGKIPVQIAHSVERFRRINCKTERVVKNSRVVLFQRQISQGKFQ